MSRALAVFHGLFGRATVYQLNRAFNVHAHREGHLIFHVGGTPAQIDVCDRRRQLIEDSVVAVNPWEPHNFLPTDMVTAASSSCSTSMPNGSRPTRRTRNACVLAAPISSART